MPAPRSDLASELIADYGLGAFYPGGAETVEGRDALGWALVCLGIDHPLGADWRPPEALIVVAEAILDDGAPHLWHLTDADTGKRLGPATAEQFRAGLEDPSGLGEIRIDMAGDVVAEGGRRVYVT